MIGLVGRVGSASQTQRSEVWFGGEDTDPMLFGEETDNSPLDSGEPITDSIFISATHQTGHNEVDLKVGL